MILIHSLRDFQTAFHFITQIQFAFQQAAIVRKFRTYIISSCKKQQRGTLNYALIAVRVNIEVWGHLVRHN